MLGDATWAERLTKTLSGVEQMALRPHVGKVFRAAEASAAHAFLETKQATGKVLLQWN